MWLKKVKRMKTVNKLNQVWICLTGFFFVNLKGEYIKG